jgi:DNA polymerase III sliding clamp (beta) subunit (PCNA family)
MPVLANVRFAAEPGVGEATLTTTDLTSTLTATVPITGTGGEFDICVDARTLRRVVRPIGRKSDGEAVVEPLSEYGMAIDTDGMTTKLAGIDPQTFPSGGDSQNGDAEWHLAGMWSAGQLRNALEFALPAVSKDITRPHLCCILISAEAIVATDGHRLHKASGPGPMKEPLLLAAHAADILGRILPSDEQVVVATAQDVVRFRCGPWQFDTKRVTAQFPPWELVMLRHDYQSTHLTLEARMLAEAVKRVMRATGERRAKVRVNGALALRSWADGVGEADVTVPTLTNTHAGDEFVIGLDLAYLRDAMVGERATVELGFDGELDPVRVDLPEDRCAVIMPLRV